MRAHLLPHYFRILEIRLLPESRFRHAGRSKVFAIFVHDADAQACAHAHRARLPVTRWQRIRSHLVRGFGHAIGFDEGHAKATLDLVYEFRRQRRAARAQKAQRGCFGGLSTAAGQQKLMHRGALPSTRSRDVRPPFSRKKAR